MLIVLFVLCIASTAFSEWRIYKRAELRNKEKNRLRIDLTLQAGRMDVRAWFMLGKKSAGVFKSNLPLYQVDDGPVHDLTNARDRRTDKKAKAWIRWVIWDGNGPIDPDLVELMNGKEAVFQYYLPDGEIKETTFVLEGVKETVEELIK